MQKTKKLLAAVIALALLTTACGGAGGSSAGGLLPGYEPPIHTMPNVPDAPPSGYDRLRLGNSPELVSIPNIVMTAYYGPYIDHMYSLLRVDEWKLIYSSYELPYAETGVVLSMRFYTGSEVYSDEVPNYFSYPQFYLFEDDSVAYDFIDYTKTPPEVEKRLYLMPEGTVQEIAGFANAFGLAGIELTDLREPFMRLLHDASIRAEAGGHSFDVTEQLSGDRDAFIATLGYDFSQPEQRDNWLFLPDPTGLELGEATAVLRSGWYTVAFYGGGHVTIEDHKQDVPVAFYLAPEGTVEKVTQYLEGLR